MPNLINQPPRFLFGANQQADHVLRLMEWIGLPIAGIELFDDEFPAKQTGACGLPVTGTIGTGIIRASRLREPVMVAIGSRGAAFRYWTYHRLRREGVPLMTLIHPSTLRAPGSVVGNNVVVMSGCNVGKGTRIGSMSLVFSAAIIEHDNIVGENAFVGPGVVTAGHVRIGDHAFIGAGAVLAPNVRIGDRALVGAGSVVVRDVPNDVVVAGVPARVLRHTRAGDDVPTLDQLNALAGVSEQTRAATDDAG